MNMDINLLNEEVNKLKDKVYHLEKMIFAEGEVLIPYLDFSPEGKELQLPQRVKVGDNGFDAYAHATVTIPAHSSAKVPLGIGVIIPEGFSIACRTRGGRWLNGLLVGGAHVDLNYRGQINALLYNVTDEDIIVEEGERPCSIDLFKTYNMKFISFDEWCKQNNFTEKEIENIMNTNRGDTGFGNSGK